MSTISDYASLESAVEDWLHRTDIAAYFEEAAQAAQNRILRDVFQSDGKGLRQMETALSDTISSNAIAVPADYISMKWLGILDNSQYYMLEPRDIGWCRQYYPYTSGSGFPYYFARDNTNFIFAPYADSAYTVDGTYYAKPTLISSSNTTNWIVTDYPDLLLYSTLLSFQPFLGDGSNAQLYGKLYQDALNDVVEMDKAERHSGGPIMSLPG